MENAEVGGTAGTGMRIVFLLWVTLLTFGLPEIFTGSGQNWPLRLDVYILGMPLYGLHFLLLVHIAVRTKRTSWPALYLFGVIFALYESWITKVIWSGYPGSDGFVMGGLGQWFGVHELLGLTLFLHPITSFLLPLAVLSRIYPRVGAYFPTPDWVFGTTKWAKIRRVVLVFIWAGISGHNMPGLPTYLFSWLSLLGALWLGYKMLKPYRETLVTSPVLSRLGVIICVLGLGFIYIVGYMVLLPERLPPTHIQLITLAAYPLLSALIWITPKRHKVAQVAQSDSPAKFPTGLVLAVFLLGLVVSVLMTINGAIGTIVGAISLVAMIPLGAGLFLWLGLRGTVFAKSRKSPTD